MSSTILDVLARGPATSRELQSATGLSQASISRQLREMEDRIVRLPEGRTIRYAMTCNAFGADDKLPLFMVDADGNNIRMALLRPLLHGGFYLEASAGMPTVLLGERGDGLYDGLPWFLDDLRPQGFLGCQIAEVLSRQSPDFPSDPRNWGTEQIGRYLIANGDDLPGNFKFGPQAGLRLRSNPVAYNRADYPRLAEAVMSGEIPGSSAGGEQPKFTAYNGDFSAHVIVKFSPRGDDAVARRWRDILITEYHAIEALHANGIPVAETRLIEGEGPMFLESQRFDRSGMHGRMSKVSLQAVDAEFTGLGSDWVRIIKVLHERKLVSWQHVYDVMVLWCFGRLINNSDMHLGNLSLAIEGDAFRLLPIYDMCSMGFAPRSGEVRPYEFKAPDIEGIDIVADGKTEARKMAFDFWARVAADERISEELREFLSRGNPVTLAR